MPSSLTDQAAEVTAPVTAEAAAEVTGSDAELPRRQALGVVVGFDGSPDAERALRWAAWDARARHAMLTVCLIEDGLPDAGAMLTPGVRLARDLMGEGLAQPLLVTGSPGAALCARAPDADLIVVGARGSGRERMPGLPIGSVSLQVAANAPGRTVVVRGLHPASAHTCMPVVVGLDGSPGSAAAARFAIEEAALRRSYVVAVCALADSPGVLGASGHIRRDAEDLIARCALENPEMPVQCKMSEGPARTALLEAGAGAQLLVVGARGRGGFNGMTIGSVGLAVISYARCPVAVVRGM
jgi:nucleotide-binding universal stress UspA family protein